MKLIKYFIFFLIALFSIVLIWINCQLNAENFDKNERKNDIICQLNFIEKELKENNLGERMQRIYPEGYIFSNVLYGLAWSEIGIIDTNYLIKQRAIKEALFAYNQINLPSSISHFDSTLVPKNGIFFLGWSNYLLSKILLIDTTFDERKIYKNIFISNSNEIVKSIQLTHTTYLQSYESQSWPADMFVAMASISNFNKCYSDKYSSTLINWIQDVKLKLDPKTKLVPHKVDYLSGETIEGSRGSSMSLIIRLLSDIDIDFAKEQYSKYLKYFVTSTFGLPSIYEYPNGQKGDGDIDSGPVILSIGFSGTIVSIGSHASIGNYQLADNQYKTINAFGIGRKSSNMKKYLFGRIPISDEFIAWSRTKELNNNKNNENSFLWSLKFHIYSVLILALLWFIIFRMI